MYKILEAKIEFKDNYVSKVIVLVQMSKGDIRAIQGDNKIKSVYMTIPSGAKIHDQLLQEVAGYGREIVGWWEDEIFREWKEKYV